MMSAGTRDPSRVLSGRLVTRKSLCTTAIFFCPWEANVLNDPMAPSQRLHYSLENDVNIAALATGARQRIFYFFAP